MSHGGHMIGKVGRQSIFAKLANAAVVILTTFFGSMDDLVGRHGSTPREWRLSFLSRAAARAARQTVLDWNPERLVIAHGECVCSGATPVIVEALRWI